MAKPVALGNVDPGSEPSHSQSLDLDEFWRLNGDQFKTLFSQALLGAFGPRAKPEFADVIIVVTDGGSVGVSSQKQFWPADYLVLPVRPSAE